MCVCHFAHDGFEEIERADFMKHYLYRTSGFIVFNSYYNGRCIYWLSFLTGALVDFVAYCDITKKEFFDILNGTVECSEVFVQFKHVMFSWEKEQAMNVRFGLEDTISLHQLPTIQIQETYKSELDIEI